MRNLYILLVVFVIIPINVSAQQGWFWQNPLPQGNSLYAVHVFDDNSAIAVGQSGTIININSDGQINQIRQNVNDKYSGFNCMFFINSERGWIGGDGYILNTEDGGVSWREIYLDTLNLIWRFNHIFFCDDTTGWISGNAVGWGWMDGIMLKSIDGGENWEPIRNDLCNTFHFINSECGWAIFGYYHWEYGIFFSLWKTEDGGNSWSEISEEAFNTIYFNNATLGWGGDYRQIKMTSDGGNTWQIVIDSIECKKITFEDESHGWALVNEDSILFTQDGGYTWQGQIFYKSEYYTLNSFDMSLNRINIAVGNGGHIRTKEPVATNWNSITSTFFNGSLSSIQIIDDNKIWLCGWEYYEYGYDPRGALVHSNDGGNTWAKTVFENQIILEFNDISFLNHLEGWAVGYNNTIKHTTDGGFTWVDQNSGWLNDHFIMEKVFFVDSLRGWILGNPYSSITYLFSTQNGGLNWNYIQNIIPPSLMGYDIFFVNKNNGWLVGHNDYDGAGEIYHTNDGGESWQINKRTNDNWRYKSVQFIDSLVGWIAGDNYGNSEVLYTEDGGENWQIIFTHLYPISDFYFSDKTHGWIIISNVYAVGNQYLFSYLPTYLYYTSNGGQNWEEYLTVPSPNINTVAFKDNNTGWIVGSNGSILKTNTGGITGLRFEQDMITFPKTCTLGQNYPNPFNPSTKIIYSVPKSSQVIIKVYDILGREVATLVNEEKPAGHYEVEFNSHSGEVQNLSSGIYFYQLRAGSFVETKKMILLK
jgi:photosystem II stability/assembly factor-like uncharacterized protein